MTCLSKYIKYLFLSAAITIALLYAPSPALAFSFSVSVSPSSGIVDKGPTPISFVITASVVDGSNPENVEFSVSGLPADTMVFFSSGFCAPTCSTVATIYGGGNAPAGRYPLTVKANGINTPSIATTTSYTLTVSDPNAGAWVERTWLQTYYPKLAGAFLALDMPSYSLITNSDIRRLLTKKDVEQFLS